MITDPQTQSSYEQADPNSNAVEDTPVGGQDDNQRILARQTPSGTSRGVQQLGGPSLSADSGNKRITVSDTVPQVLMGNQPTFGEGFYVSKLGKDVTSPQLTGDDFIFNSNQNVFKIIDKLPFTATVPSSTHSAVGVYLDFSPATQTPHGLDFVPGFLAFQGSGQSFADISFQAGGAAGGTGSPYNMEYVDETIVLVDTTFVYYQISRKIRIYTAGSQTIPAYTNSGTVYLLQETAN